MAAVRSQDTGPELVLRERLAALTDLRQIDFSTGRKDLPGSPDIAFEKAKVAVFCDGEFWHGRHWKQRKAKIEFKVRSEYWIRKIEENRRRDRRVVRQLRTLGWYVVRLWNKDIVANPETRAREILGLVACRLDQ